MQTGPITIVVEGKREKVTGETFLVTEAILDGYAAHNPSISRADAQRAAIRQMQASRALDEKFRTGIPESDKFALRRLEALGVDQKTLEIVE